MRHDIKQHLSVWKRLIENNNFDETARQIAEFENRLAASYLTDVGSDAANAIINEKIAIAAEKGVTVEINGAFEGGLKIKGVDLCSLLGNLFDNAIDAAAEVSDPEKRLLSMNISRKEDILLLRITNTYAQSPVVQNNRLVSSKGGARGLGLLSIENVTAQYCGVMQNSFADGVFNTNIMMKGYSDY
jgi:sensor histidine kinase regulating citrate/malate metabolism